MSEEVFGSLRNLGKKKKSGFLLDEEEEGYPGSLIKGPLRSAVPQRSLEAVGARPVLQEARKVDPRRAAEVNRLARRTMRSPLAVEEDIDAARLIDQDLSTDYNALRKETPTLYGYMSRPSFAAVAHGDIEPLGKVERALRNYGEELSEQFRAGILMARVGALGTERAFAKLGIGEMEPGELEQLSSMYHEMNRLREHGYGTALSMPFLIAEQAPVMANALAHGGAGALIGGGLGALVGALGGPLGVAAGLKFGGMIGAFIGAFKLEGGLIHEDLQRWRDPQTGQRLTEEQILAGFLVGGAVNGALESLGAFASTRVGRKVGHKVLGHYFGSEIKDLVVDDVKSAVLAEVGKGLLTEGLTEGAQEIIPIIWPRVMKSIDPRFPGYTPIDAAIDITFDQTTWSQMAQAFGAGAFLGGVFGGAAAPLRARQMTAINTQVIREQKYLEQARDGAAESVLKQEDADAFAQFHAAARMNGNVPVENAYVSISAIDDWLEEHPEMGDEEVAQTLHVPVEAIQMAREFESDVAVNIDDYIAHVSTTELHDAIKNDVKLSANGFTLRDIASRLEFATEQGELIEEEVLRALEEGDSIEGDLGEVRKLIVEQLEAAGESPEDVMHEAAMFVAGFRAIGEKANLTPLEYYHQFTPVFGGPGMNLIAKAVERGDIGNRVLDSRDASPNAPAAAWFDDYKFDIIASEVAEIPRYADDDYSHAFVVRIPGEWFLKLTTGSDNGKYSSYNGIMKGTDPFKQGTGAKLAGANIPAAFEASEFDKEKNYPMLWVATDGTVLEHEGRHRTASLMRGGAESVPVVIRVMTKSRDGYNIDESAFPKMWRSQFRGNPDYTHLPYVDNNPLFFNFEESAKKYGPPVKLNRRNLADKTALRSVAGWDSVDHLPGEIENQNNSQRVTAIANMIAGAGKQGLTSQGLSSSEQRQVSQLARDLLKLLNFQIDKDSERYIDPDLIDQPDFTPVSDVTVGTGSKDENRTVPAIKWNPPKTADGKIKGSPEWVDSPAKFKRMRKIVRQLAEEGRAGRYWYEQSAKGVLRIVGGDIVEADKFMQLLAIYSPQNYVYHNTMAAVKAWTQFKTGVSPEDFHVSTSDRDAKAIYVLYGSGDAKTKEEVAKARKTNSFYHNLMYPIARHATPAQLETLRLTDKEMEAITSPVTADVWVFRGFGYDSDVGGGDVAGTGRYSFAANEMHRIAAEWNQDLKEGEVPWQPWQIQAAIWTATKARFEQNEVKKNTEAESLKAGHRILKKNKKGVLKPLTTPGYYRISTGEHLGSTRDQAYKDTPPTDRESHAFAHGRIWRKHAMKADPEVVKEMVGITKGSFADSLTRLSKFATWEARPSEVFDYDINKASLPVQRAFTAEAEKIILDEDGLDELAGLLGVPLSVTAPGTGGYDGAISANVISQIIPIKEALNWNNEQAEAYARVIQYIYKQEAVPWFRIDSDAQRDVGYRVKPVEVFGSFASEDDANTYISGSQEKNLQVRQVDDNEYEVVRVGATKKGSSSPIEAEDFAEAEQEKLAEIAAKGTGKSKASLKAARTRMELFGGEISRGVMLEFDREITEEIEERFFANLRSILGPGAGYTKMTPRHIAILNFRGGFNNTPFMASDEDFFDKIMALGVRHGKDLGIKSTAEAIDVEGHYGYVHDWSNGPEGDPTGERIFDQDGIAGLNSVQDWARDRREEFEALIERYSGDELKKREQEVAVHQGLTGESDTVAQEDVKYARDKKGRVLGAMAWNKDRSRAYIEKFAAGDASTLLHEGAHFFTETIFEMIARGGPSATPEIREMGAALLAWVGADSYESMTSEQAEHIARGFERYVMEGVVPNLELRPTMEFYKAQLNFIYRTVRTLASPNDLTDDARRVFDQMLATNEQIAEARMQMGYEVQPFTEEDLSELTEVERKELNNAYQRASVEAEQAEMTKVAGKVLNEANATKADDIEKAMPGIIAELETRPVYAVKHWLSTGQVPDVFDMPQSETSTLTIDDLATAGLQKLSRDGVEELVGVGEQLDIVLDTVGRANVVREGGVHPDILAELFGFDDGIQMIESLKLAENIEVAARDIAEQQWEAELAGKATEFGAAAFDAIHGDSRASTLAAEAKLMERIAGRRAKRAAARAAERTVGDEGPLDTADYDAEIKSAKARLADATESGDGAAAAVARQALLIAQERKKTARPVRRAVRALEKRQRAAQAAGRRAEREGRVRQSELRDRARRVVRDTPMVDLAPSRRLATERKLRAESDVEWAKGTPESMALAADLRRASLMAHYMYIEETRAMKEANKNIKWASSMLKKKKRAAMYKNAPNLADKFYSLMELYDLKKGRTKMSIEYARRIQDTLRAFYDAQENADNPVMADARLFAAESEDQFKRAEQEYIRARAKGDEPAKARAKEKMKRAKDIRMSWKQLTPDEMGGLFGTLQHWEHNARKFTQLLVVAEAAELDDVIEEIKKTITANVPPLDVDPPNTFAEDPRFFERKKKSFIDALKDFNAINVKMEQFIIIMDGGTPGWMHKTLFQPLADAEVLRDRLINASLGVIDKAFKDLPLVVRKHLQDMIIVPELNGARMTRLQLMMVALNSGNEGNLFKLWKGYESWGWTEAGLLSAINKYLSKEEATAIQTIWDEFEKHKPMIWQVERLMTGLTPIEVAPREVMIGGKKMRGGYFPIVYDPEKDRGVKARARKNESDMFDGNYGSSIQTNHDHVKHRTAEYARPILLDLRVIDNHIRKVVHDYTHRPVITDLAKIVRDPRFKDLVDLHFGPQYTELFEPWLRGVANTMAITEKSTRRFENFMRKRRQNLSLFAMGYKFTTAVQQPMGITQSYQVLKGNGSPDEVRKARKYLGSAISRFVAHPLENSKAVFAKSGFMERRAETHDATIEENVRRLSDKQRTGGISASIATFERYAFWHIGVGDTMVSVPTWMAAYDIAISEGKSEAESVALADSAVRISQGSGSAKDLTALQRGLASNSEAYKAFVTFYSYFSSLYNREWLATRRVHEEGSAGLPRFLVDQFWLVIVASIGAELLSGRGPDEDDDETWGEWLAVTPLSHALGSVPIVRNIAGAVIHGYDVAAVPLDPALNGLAKTLRESYEIVVEQDPPTKSETKQMIKGAGVWFGKPTSQLLITGETLYDRIIDGEDVSLWYLFYPQPWRVGKKPKKRKVRIR